MKPNKSNFRKRIDEIDNRILGLLNQRAKLVLEIGKLKRESDENFYIPLREKEVLLRTIKNNRGPLTMENVEGIFSEILHSCRALQSKLRVTYLGPEGSFSHLAATKNFGKYCDFLPVATIEDIFQEVEKGRADYGIVPIENSTEGIVFNTLDMFIEFDLTICSEMNLPVELCLLSKSDTLKDIRKVYTKLQVIGQCRKWLESNLPGVPVIEQPSTSMSAKLAAREKYTAAISTSLAGELYGLKTLACGIEDVVENYTRFLVICKRQDSAEQYRASSSCKTSILFSIKDKIGALHDMLVPFKRYNINLTKIESRPTKKKAWEYVFFIDFLGNTKDKRVERALQELKKQCLFLKILGSYPKAE